MSNWYCGSTKYTAVAQWAANTVYGAGAIVRQLAAPAVGSERCFRTALGGTSHATTEPIWVTTKGAAQPTDGTITDWVECTGNETYGWTAAHARLANALAWMAAGDTCWLSNNHAETQATNLILTSPGTAALPITVLCVIDTATPPTTLATTASISVTSVGDMYIYGIIYLYGITLNVGTDAYVSPLFLGTTTPTCIIFDNCNIKIVSVGTASHIYCGTIPHASTNDDSLVILKNTNIQFGATAQRLLLGHAKIYWIGGSIIGSVFPTTLITLNPSCVISAEINGCDLSPLGSNNLVNGAVACAGTIKIKNCKLGAGAIVLTGTIPGQGGIEVLLDNCDSGDTNYRFAHHKYQGSIIQATNCYLNATYSMKMTPITGAAYISPLESPPIAQWNNSVGSAKTATIEIIHSEAADLDDDEIWVELEYLGTSGFPLASFVDDKMAWFGTPAAQTTSTAAWTEDLAGERKQKLSVSFTPQEAGYIVAKVYLAKVTTNPVYIDPYITVA